MKRALLAAAVVLAVGCGGSHAPPAQQPAAQQPAAPIANQVPPATTPPPTKMATMISKLGEFQVQMCACHDAPCVQHVSDDMARWGQEQADDPATQGLKPNDDEATRIMGITKAMTDCMTRAMAVGSGGSASP